MIYNQNWLKIANVLRGLSQMRFRQKTNKSLTEKAKLRFKGKIKEDARRIIYSRQPPFRPMRKGWFEVSNAVISDPISI